MKGLFIGSGMRMAVATAMLCGATFGGHYVLTSDNGAFPPPASSVLSPSRPTFHGVSPTNPSSGSGTSAPSLRGNLGGASARFGGTGGTTVGSSASSASTTSLSGYSGGASMTLSRTGFSPTGSAAGGGGSASGVSTGGSSLAVAVATYAVSSSSVGSVASSPARSPLRSNVSPLSESGELALYEGDAPGVIFHDDYENPVITSYGQPIGDMIFPLLLMAVVYGLCMIMRKYKLNRHR